VSIAILIAAALLGDGNPGDGGFGSYVVNEFGAGVLVTGNCPVNPPLQEGVCVAYSGIRMGFHESDAAPQSFHLHAESAYPPAATNTDGGDLHLIPGAGVRRGVMTASGCDDGVDTVTITVDGGINVGTDGTEFDCDGETDADCAESVATWVDAIGGVGACAGATCTAFTGVAGTWYLWRTYGHDLTIASNDDPACAALTSGASGQVVLGAGKGTTTYSDVVFGADGGGISGVGTGLYFYANTNAEMSLDTNGFRGIAGPSTMYLLNEQASATNPGVARAADLDTGLGASGDDCTTLIAGAKTGVDVCEASNEVQVKLSTACTFTNLGTPAAPSICACSDCTVGVPCTGSGSGSIAMYRAGAWGCY